MNDSSISTTKSALTGAALAVGPLNHPTREDVVAALRSEPHDRLEVGTHRLAYWKFGSGPDLVFVHGWPLHSATFRAIVPLLADRFTCHLVDLPGSGKTTSAPRIRTSFESHAETLRDAIEALGLARYALFAHDSGGLTARLAAVDDPRVVALVTGNTDLPGYMPPAIRPVLFAARTPGGADLLRLAMRMRHFRRSRFYCGCFHDLDFIDGDFHELLVAPLVASRRVWVRQLDLLCTLEPELLDRLPALHARLTMPVLLIWGAADPIFPVERARTMVTQFPRATLVEIEQARAYAHEEQPEAFVARAKPFLVDAFRRARLAFTEQS